MVEEHDSIVRNVGLDVVPRPEEKWSDPDGFTR